jgi:hypothetical protein
MNALTAIGGFANEHAPAILVGAGIVGFVATVVLACKATTKLDDILKESEEKTAQAENFDPEEHEGAEYTEEDRAKDLKLIRLQTRLKIVRNYAIPAAIGVASIASILVGFKVLNGRYLLATSAYATLEGVYNKYRDRIRNKYGEAADRYGNTGIWEDEVLHDNEDGTTTPVKVVTSDVEPVEKVNGHMHLLGPGDYLYDKCGGDLKLIKSQLLVYQAEDNRMYERGEYVNENEVLSKIFTKDSHHMTDIGQISGWCRRDKESEEGQSMCVDYGCWDYSRSKDNPDLITQIGPTMDGTEDVVYVVLNMNARQVSFANINEVKAAPRDRVRVRRGGKYISQ